MNVCLHLCIYTFPCIRETGGRKNKLSKLKITIKIHVCQCALPVHFYSSSACLFCAQLCTEDACQALSAQLAAVPEPFQGMPSGCLRVEVPLPRGVSALRWLQGQSSTEQQPEAAVGPLIYFSGRHSSAPDTPLAAQAEACTKGWFAVAGKWDKL